MFRVAIDSLANSVASQIDSIQIGATFPGPENNSQKRAYLMFSLNSTRSHKFSPTLTKSWIGNKEDYKLVPGEELGL